MDRLRPWQRTITALATLKVLLSIGLFAMAFTAASSQVTRRDLLMAAHVVVYAGAAALLLVLGRRDLRASILGVAFLLTAAVFADNAAIRFNTPSALVHYTVRMVFALQVDAFSAYFLWFFVQEFPRVSSFGARYRVPRIAMRASLVVGIALFTVNVARAVAILVSPEGSTVSDVLVPFARENDHGLYWPVQYGLSLSAFVVLIWKARVAPVTEARRVALLIGGLALGTGPTIVWVLLASVSPMFRRVLPLHVAGWVLYPTLLSTPLTTAYAVLVHQALNARLIVRRAIRYAFARYTVLSVAALPVMILLVTLYRQRSESMKTMMSGGNAALLSVLAIGALLASRGSRNALDRLDRRFFREQYDARLILGALVERCQRAASRMELAEGLRAELVRALHPTSVNVLFLEPGRMEFCATRGELRPLPATSEIVKLLQAANTPLNLDLENRKGVAARLPSMERYWLADAGAQLLFPITNAQRQPIGIVALGEKRSELPFSAEDRSLLSTVSAAAALSLSALSIGDAGAAVRRAIPDTSIMNPASLCIACGQIGEPDTLKCRRCGSPSVRASLPRVLAGKFRLEDRIGEGGMGVVYRAIDVTLNREVAIKTLPLVSPRAAARLRREARAMAAINHPNLALIYGGESWNGMPLLVVEYLPRGTLAKRIGDGPLPYPEVLRLGIALADVTSALHGVGILHRDIKPSNIGYAADGTPKLLDFGLARLLSSDTSAHKEPNAVLTGAPPNHEAGDSIGFGASVDGVLIGTPNYMSPEALRGLTPAPSFDLWSIGVVLIEALSGTHPGLLDASHQIDAATLQNLNQSLPNADPQLSRFFAAMFARNPTERPQSANALREELLVLSNAVR